MVFISFATFWQMSNLVGIRLVLVQGITSNLIHLIELYYLRHAVNIEVGLFKLIKFTMLVVLSTHNNALVYNSFCICVWISWWYRWLYADKLSWNLIYSRRRLHGRTLWIALNIHTYNGCIIWFIAIPQILVGSHERYHHIRLLYFSSVEIHCIKKVPKVQSV